MTKTTIGLSGYLVLWLAIFAGRTLYPHAQTFSQGMRGTGGGWQEQFREHEELLRFVALTSPWAASANGRVLFAYGGEPVPGKVHDFLAATQYLLYPTRMFRFPSGGSAAISYIAVYQAREEAFAPLPFCREVGGRSYLCEVVSGGSALQGYDIHAEYKAPDVIIQVRRKQEGRLVPAVVIVSFKVPFKYGSDFNVLLVRQSPARSLPGEAPAFRLDLTVETAPLPVYQFQVLAVDREGLLAASEERRLIFGP